jgi:hypothetical protein
VKAPPDLLGFLLDALADRIALRITTAPERETYDSRHLPPRTSRRRFAEVCRSGRVVEARREGRDWTCSRGAWEAARSRRSAVRPATAERHAAADLDSRAADLLARAGLRLIGGSR